MTCGVGLALTGCGKDEPPAASPDPTAAVAEAPPAPPPVEPAASPVESPWTPEALEDLLAPVALYPDPVLATVLATSTNPQEVLDAGNWLIQNPELAGEELESAATAAGFTPPMIALVQFPTVVDMMCMQMDWTAELGTAFRTDEPGVLAAVQRLRKQAAEMGNLTTSEQMTVSTETHQDQQVIVVEPAQPQVVYVPQYDPQAVYTQPPPAAPTTAAATTTTQTGHSTGTLVTTGLLAFGAGILVSEIFDDDDDDHWDYPHWGYGYGGPPYYPPPYRPRYGGGWGPSHNYRRPPNYRHSFNNNNVYINTGDDYWRRFDTDRRDNYRREARSPITAARPNRPELQNVNSELRSRPPIKRSSAPAYAGARDRDAAAKVQQRAPAAAGARDRQPAVQGSYAGARDRDAAAKVQQRAPAAAGARDRQPAVQGGYAGARDRDAAAKVQQRAPAAAGARDRGRGTQTAAPARTQQVAAAGSTPRREQGLQHARERGSAERAASKRGRESMSQGARKQPTARNKAGGERKRRN